eukprot:gene11872-8159_t
MPKAESAARDVRDTKNDVKQQETTCPKGGLHRLPYSSLHLSCSTFLSRLMFLFLVHEPTRLRTTLPVYTKVRQHL